jgi:hypothetical protein
VPTTQTGEGTAYVPAPMDFFIFYRVVIYPFSLNTLC